MPVINPSFDELRSTCDDNYYKTDPSGVSDWMKDELGLDELPAAPVVTAVNDGLDDFLLYAEHLAYRLLLLSIRSMQNRSKSA